MHPGDTLLIPAPGGPSTPHLWIIVTEPVKNVCVIVNVTTLRNEQDQTVTLNVGDHPFIRHASVVKFADARFADDLKLFAEVASRNAVPKEPCPPATLKLIQDGLIASPFTPKKIVAFCKEQWGMGGATATLRLGNRS